MAQTDISENIYQAIDTLIDARLQNINFNSTVLCTVIDDSKAASGIFTVDNAGVKFQATSLDKSLRNNDQVYVTIPNNDFSAQKIILCKKDDFEEEVEGWRDPLNYLDIKYKFDDDSDIVSFSPTNNVSPAPDSVLIKQIILNDDINLIYTDSTYHILPGTNSCTSNGINYLNEEDQNHIKDILWIKTQWAQEYVGYKQNSASKYFQELKDAGWAECIPTLEDYNYTFAHASDPTSLYAVHSKPIYRSLLLRGNRYDPTRCFIHTYPYKPIDQNTNISAMLKLGPRASRYTPTTNDEYCYIWTNDLEQEDISFFGPNDRIYNKYYQNPPGNMGIMYLGYCVFYNEKQYQPIKLAGLKNIIFSIDCKTDLYNDNMISGTYGAYCDLEIQNCNDLTENSQHIQLYLSNERDFLGDTYNFFDFYTQTALFDVSNYQDYQINKIKFYAYQDNNFVNTEHTTNFTSSIQFCNPKIYIGLPKKETEIGYKNYQSSFRTNHDYYQSLTYTNLYRIKACLDDNPPVDTELLSDGPFDWTARDGTAVKRYKPKIYIKDENNTYIEDSTIKYFDQIQYIEDSSWSNNKYIWDGKKKQWKYKDDGTYQTFYVCYPAGREYIGYVGAIDRTDESEPIQLGVSTNTQNLDVVLSTSARNSNIYAITESTNSQIVLNAADRQTISLNDNNNILLNNNNKSTIELNDDTLELNFKNTSIINLNDNSLDLYTQDSGHYGKIRMSIDNTSNSQGILLQFYNNNDDERCKIKVKDNGSSGSTFGGQINISIKNTGGTWKSVELTGARINSLAKILNNYNILKDLVGWDDGDPY